MITWTLMMAKISPVIADNYIENNRPDKLIEMGLITPEEVEKLSEKDGTTMIWSDKWWMPMTWNMLIVNNEMNENGHLPRYLLKIYLQICMIIQEKVSICFVILLFSNNTSNCTSICKHCKLWGFFAINQSDHFQFLTFDT